MSVEAMVALASFIGLFAAWVILPSRLKKKHETKAESETPEQSV